MVKINTWHHSEFIITLKKKKIKRTNKEKINMKVIKGHVLQGTLVNEIKFKLNYFTKI